MPRQSRTKAQVLPLLLIATQTLKMTGGSTTHSTEEKMKSNSNLTRSQMRMRGSLTLDMSLNTTNQSKVPMIMKLPDQCTTTHVIKST